MKQLKKRDRNPQDTIKPPAPFPPVDGSLEEFAARSRSISPELGGLPGVPFISPESSPPRPSPPPAIGPPSA